MSVFAAISLLAAIMAAALGTFVLYRNTRGALNRVFFLYCLAGSATSFAEFEYRKAESFDTSLFWMRVPRGSSPYPYGTKRGQVCRNTNGT